MVQSLLEYEKKPDVYKLGVAEGIKEMLALRGFTKEKIPNSTVSNLAEDSPDRLLCGAYHL
ncbi:MAG: hypothetical protein WCE95_06760 [Nitrososphaeraceae archaeon]